jgi:hypothetical protein
MATIFLVGSTIAGLVIQVGTTGLQLLLQSGVPQETARVISEKMQLNMLKDHEKETLKGVTDVKIRKKIKTEHKKALRIITVHNNANI